MPRGWALVKAILVAPFAALLGVLVGVHLFIPAGIIEWLFGIEDGTLWVPAQFVGSGLGAIAAIVIVFRCAARVDGRNTYSEPHVGQQG